ncbi:MAG TPA: hypothetical protein VFQ45_22735 [Longimicrobium sp.]|nr:hypothetical protein [Longimicrobium sp.]
MPSERAGDCAECGEPMIGAAEGALLAFGALAGWLALRGTAALSPSPPRETGAMVMRRRPKKWFAVVPVEE